MFVYTTVLVTYIALHLYFVLSWCVALQGAAFYLLHATPTLRVLLYRTETNILHETNVNRSQITT